VVAALRHIKLAKATSDRQQERCGIGGVRVLAHPIAS
jgi:hypothetical protein